MTAADSALRLLDAVLAELPGSDPREGQRTMVREVAHAISSGRHLLVQAGTGTGKSVGYLVPALAAPRKVLVSTATKGLQAQLVEKDLPRVVAAVKEQTGREITYAVAKGRRNYLCLERVHGDSEQAEIEMVVPTTTNEQQAKQLREWAEETESGDRDEVDFAVSDVTWRALSVDGRDCLGAKCPWRDECFAERAKLTAQLADVVVANHSMLALDACTEAQILPERDVVIIDEAHELERFVTDALTAEISATATARAVRLANPLLNESTKDALAQSLTDIDRLLFGLQTGLLPQLPSDARVLLAAFERITERAASEIGGADEGEDAAEVEESRDFRAKSALRDLAGAANLLLAAGPMHAIYVERTKEGGPARLRVSPLRVDDRLADRLLTHTPVIATSATLAVDGSFDYAAMRLGFGREVEDEDRSPRKWSGVDVGSPFDYPRQAQLYVAAHLPSPKERDAWEAAVDAELVDLIGAAGGRTLALFSSRRAAERAAAHVREKLDVPVLVQGEDTPGRLAWRFASDARTCLFGTRGLWHGLDVPGSACQLVIIDRIPFSHMDNPLHKARMDRAGTGGFGLVAIPEAAIALAQGVGRLIRRPDDRGVVAILDTRVLTASYGTRLLRSLPPMYRTRDREQVLKSLRAIDASAPPPLPVGPEPGKRLQAASQQVREQRAAAGWDEQDDALLKLGVSAGRPIAQLAERHEVTEDEILAHLQRLGLAEAAAELG